MENNLDKYFKDKLHDREFEMKEAYWLGAEQLLDAQDKRRKRRVFFWWFNAGLGLLFVAGLGWWFFGKNGGERPTEVTQNMAQQTQPASDGTAPVFEETTEQNASAQSGETLPAEADDTPFAEGKTNPTTNQSNHSTIKQSTDNQRVVNKKARSLFSNKAIKPEQTTTSEAVSTAPKLGEGTTPIIAEQKTAESQTQAEILPLAPGENEVFERLDAPDHLALLLCLVEGDFGKKALAAGDKIVPAKRTKMHLGLMASQLLQANPDSGEVTRLGYRVGLSLRLDLQGGWYLGSGLQYQRRSGTFEATKLAAQRNYRFGLELDTLHLRPNSLHYLSVPVMLGWQKRRHQLEGGLLLDFLTGVHGETGSYQKQGEPPVKVFEADKKGWMTKDGYRKFAPTAQLAYHYRLVGKWSLGVSANYTLGGILDKGYEPPLGGFLLKESNKFYVGLQGVYFIN